MKTNESSTSSARHGYDNARRRDLHSDGLRAKYTPRRLAFANGGITGRLRGSAIRDGQNHPNELRLWASSIRFALAGIAYLLCNLAVLAPAASLNWLVDGSHQNKYIQLHFHGSNDGVNIIADRYNLIADPSETNLSVDGESINYSYELNPDTDAVWSGRPYEFIMSYLDPETMLYVEVARSAGIIPDLTAKVRITPDGPKRDFKDHNLIGYTHVNETGNNAYDPVLASQFPDPGGTVGNGIRIKGIGSKDRDGPTPGAGIKGGLRLGDLKKNKGSGPTKDLLSTGHVEGGASVSGGAKEQILKPESTKPTNSETGGTKNYTTYTHNPYVVNPEGVSSQGLRKQDLYDTQRDALKDTIYTSDVVLDRYETRTALDYPDNFWTEGLPEITGLPAMPSVVPFTPQVGSTPTLHAFGSVSFSWSSVPFIGLIRNVILIIVYAATAKTLMYYIKRAFAG